MEIIIQGKPISGSKISTSGIETSLVDRIYKDFFEKMGGIRSSQALIVDTIFWQNSWYSIYTYSRYSGIIDTADRQSYFALSIVVPKNFLYLTSGVYHLLQKAYHEKIEGVYISKVGKYLVSDFSDAKVFNAIVEYISKEFANSNLEDPIDNEFKKTHAANAPVYNLLDCDSIAFLKDLKDSGRVIVGEGAEFPQKCSASVLQSKELQIDSLNTKNLEQGKVAEQLKKDLEEAQRAAQSNANNRSAEINKLKAEIEQLKKENTQAKSQISAKQKELDNLVQKIQALVPDSPKTPLIEEELDIDQEKSLFKRILDYIPLLNSALLIVLCLCFLFVRPSTPKLDDNVNAELKAENARLREDIKKKDTQIQEQTQVIQSFNFAQEIQNRREHIEEVRSATMDVDCNIQITRLDNTPVVSNDIVPNGTIVKIVWNQQPGYQWHTTNNLDKDAVVELQNGNQNGEAFVTINRTDSKAVILWYRANDPQSGDQSHRNIQNRFILK